MSTAAMKNLEAAAAATKRSGDTNGSWRDKPEQILSQKGAVRGRSRAGGAGRHRSGRGSGRNSGKDVSDTKPQKINVSNSTVEQSDSSAKTSAGGNLQANVRGLTKTSNRPSLAVDVSVAPSEGTPSPYSPSKPSRRRRNTHKRIASSKVPPPNGSSSPSDPVLLAKDSNGLSNMSAKQDSTVPVHDLREDIRNLVDHVRSFAIENNRPSSPSTHIDWAGEDDDSLPDLDDWGISSKLTSDMDVSIKESDSKHEYPAHAKKEILEPSYALEGNEEKPYEQSNLAQTIDIPVELTSSHTSESLQPKRERRRERGSKRDRGKKGQLPNSQSNSSNSLVSTTPKKSLLERLSSPVRSSPPSSSPNRVLNHVVVPPSVRTIVSSNRSPPKPLYAVPKVQPSTDSDTQIKQLHTDDVVYIASTETETGAVSEDANSFTSSQATKVEPTEVNKLSFDWSDEPMDFDTLPVFDPPPKTVSPPVVDVPRMHPEISAPLESSALNVADVITRPNPRLRSQRPLSSDTTHRSRNDRPTNKTHNSRNQSEPHVPSPATARTRAPTSTRPKIRSEALEMLSRSLRESPTTKTIK